MNMDNPVDPPACTLALDPADVSAWLVDGEPGAALDDTLPEGFDLSTHVEGCASCAAAARSVAASRDVASALLEVPAPVAPPAVTHRAVGRVRLEAQAVLFARTFGGALARVLDAAPTYLLRPTTPAAGLAAPARQDDTTRRMESP